MELLNHRTFYNMILAGAHQLIEEEQELNKINVFPVADGDTGTNLAHLMRMIIRETKWTEPSSTMLERMRAACLRGSRGNSGMIFSQFIIAMCNYIDNHKELEREQFLEMCEYSVEKSYSSVQEPQEGTVLTVMKDWVKLMRDTPKRSIGILGMMQDSYAGVCASLENTKTQLKVLQKHNVVDAGAKGFVHFLQGLMESINPMGEHTGISDQKDTDRSSAEELVLDSSTGDIHAFFSSEPIVHRYCTEFLFDVDTNLSNLKTSLSLLGDSFVLIGDNKQGKIHIHTNFPDRVAELINENGSIIDQKVEDMKRQHEALYQRKAAIAIVVDSACDLPQEWMDEYQIHLLPLHLQIGHSSYLDKVTLQPESFYNKLEESIAQPTTSQPTQQAISSLYQNLLSNYEHVISIHLSKELSGTYEACRTAAEHMDPARIHVINSRTLSGAYGLLVQRVAKAVESRRSIHEVKALLHSWVPRSEILVSVPSLKYMVRGGRVSPFQGKIARWLDMKPIISVDPLGKSMLYGKTFFRRSNLSKMIQMVSTIHHSNQIESYAILHANAQAEGNQCEEEMTRMTGQKPLFISNVSSVIGLNAGKGAVSVAMLLRNNNLRRTK